MRSNELDDDDKKILFLGSSIETLEKIKLRSRKDFPNVDVYTHSPPFKDDFTVDENRQMFDIINEVQPDILFIGMTCPKQEKWAHKNKSYVDVSLICGIGAVFDWYAGNYKEISPIWWKLRMGWLIRAVQRPELLSRNVPNYYIFFKDLVLTFLRFKKF